ncbi:AAA family ATPase [Citrobacter braakii]|uniref:AAA family ATPase n=1 Tax=Citrobacter braakii TaxID=57706 RepID=UPI003974E4B9
MTLFALEALGPRICIMGPSNSGKSTLTEAMSRKTNLPAIHLDQLYHLPGSNWVPRDNYEFLRLHKEVISQEKWIIDGNYLKCIEARLERATGLILFDLSLSASLLRYIQRCYSKRPMLGGLGTGREHIRWQMLKHLTLYRPDKRKRYRTVFTQADLPKLFLPTQEDVRAYYHSWHL